ncbi:DNA polymerase IV [Phreatobacter oligotrophus]|uniref:DNA polymerase IV n=1 Tax=Phreatobacter oligotrophus TaxID=1122261 RepID=A0A2T4Z533_9HYPH|nr:DNA polymerase IV [Phreatobacter oligotrophus]PTM57014.1 DNA polymerase-4 [Phreatobacter oligotrophus]
MALLAFCRDCFAEATGEAPRCRACGSPRLARHGELGELSIAHVDCDAFYAAIEKRDDPSLVDKPLIVGGGRRGVVSTCCYVARIHGVRSAMPMFKALALCPDAVVIKPNMEKYAAVGRQVRQAMLALTPLVEPLSIDEAFLDLTGTERLHGAPPALTLARFARQVEKEIGITISVGLSYNKFLAKIASDLDKPRGFAVIGRGEALDFLGAKPVSLIWGVGKAMQQALERDGLKLIADLRRIEESELMRRYGAMGLRLARLCRGIDDRRVSPDGETKSVSAETTFDTDIRDGRALEKILFRLCEKVSARAKAQGLAGNTVTLKLKSADFKIRTRSRGLPTPTVLAARLFETGREMLAREADGTAYRLIGIGLSDLTTLDKADPADLVDTSIARNVKVEGAVDALRAKFGRGAVVKGITFDD